VTATVRLAGDADVPVVAALRRAWTEENAGAAVDDDEFEAAFAAWFEQERHQRLTWLAEAAGRAVGMLNLLVFTRMPRPRSAAVPGAPRLWGYVANVYVVPAARDTGVGTLLLAAVTAHADEHGYARLVLSPTERSVPLYRRAGFAPATSLLLRPGR
jgi:GNAT superfamily N-acetyltransferase